jgi:aryl sulfotransferase
MRVLQAGIDKSGNYWLYRIIRLLMDAASIPRKSWILQDPIFQIAKDWELSFPGANELDVITWDATPARAYTNESYAAQPLRDRSYYYCVIPMYRRRIQDLDAYVEANTHLWTHAPWHDDLPAQLLNKIDKTVYIVRDPRDVLVSGAHFVDSAYCRREFGLPRIPLPERFERLMVSCPEWAVHVAGWIANAKQAGVHVVSYEGLATDLRFQLRRLAEYFEIDVSDAQLQRVEDQVAFDSMKSNTQTEHVRKGVMGNWKNELPERVANDAANILSPLLERLGYQNTSGELSRFLTHGELSSEISDVFAQINELQAQAGIQAAPRRNTAGPTRAQTPVQATGWR